MKTLEDNSYEYFFLTVRSTPRSKWIEISQVESVGGGGRRERELFNCRSHLRRREKMNREKE